jgi:probable DNA repair protein
LTPSTEISAALLRALERSYQLAGREVWPTPRVRDFRGWLRERHAERQFAHGDSPRCLSDFEERELWREIISADSSRAESLDPGVAARLAQRARRGITEHAIPWRPIVAQAAAETETFLDWNRQFDERCRTLNCVTVDSLIDGLQAPGEAVYWLQTPSWRPAARAWLAQHGRPLAPCAVAGNAVFKMRAQSPDAEMAAAADWARRRLQSEGEFRAWICVPELATRRAEVIDAFDAALAPHRFGFDGEADLAPYAIAGGTPLAGYAPVRIALETLETGAAAIPFTRFSALLRSPYLQDCDEQASHAALLDAKLRERAPSEAAMPAWLDLAEATTLSARLAPAAAVARLRAVHTALAAVSGTRRFSGWLPAWMAALERGPWSQPARWSSTEYQAVERFRELLTVLASADVFFGSHSRDSAQRLLRRAARETTFQPQTGVPPIWVSGQLADPWLSYDGLWVSGMSAEAWPAPIETLALLPVQVQRDYGVTAACFEAQVRSAAELQQRWLQRAGECVFSHADASDGRAGAPSPLLPSGAAILDTGDASQPRPHWHAQYAAAPLLERYVDELAPAFGAADRTRGVASLRAQSLCPFRGFAETRLRADGLEQPVPGFNASERGQLVHHVLEHVWSVLRDSRALEALDPDVQRELIEAGAERALRAVCARRDPGATWRRRERTRLHNLLGKWLQTERRRQPFAVEWLEREAKFASAGLVFNLRIDRADRLLQDGARILIDYKTGNASADWRGERPANPQLPIYGVLNPESLAAVAYANVNAAEPTFVCESERADLLRPGLRRTSLEGSASLAALLEIWSGRIDALAAGLATGQAQVAPTATACRYCRLQGLCRVPSMLDDEEAI